MALPTIDVIAQIVSAASSYLTSSVSLLMSLYAADRDAWYSRHSSSCESSSWEWSCAPFYKFTFDVSAAGFWILFRSPTVVLTHLAPIVHDNLRRVLWVYQSRP